MKQKKTKLKSQFLTLLPPPGRRVSRRNSSTGEGGWAPWRPLQDRDKGGLQGGSGESGGHGGSGESGGHGGSRESGGHGGSRESGGHGGSGDSGGHGETEDLGGHGRIISFDKLDRETIVAFPSAFQPPGI